MEQIKGGTMIKQQQQVRGKRKKNLTKWTHHGRQLRKTRKKFKNLTQNIHENKLY